MRKLIEKFYSLSSSKRLLTVVVSLIIIATVATVFSFINLFREVQFLNDENSGDSKKLKKIEYIGFENIPTQRNLLYLDDQTKSAFASWKTLTDFSARFLQDGSGSKLYQLSEEVAKHDQEVVSAIRSFNRLEWKYLSVFASRQVDPIEGGLVESFRKIRRTAQFLASFHSRFKEKFPGENSAFIFESALKLARITDLSSPFLIGKMVSIGVDGIAVKSILPMIDSGTISSQEAVEMKDALKNSMAIDCSLLGALENEFVFFKHFYANLYERAPLAMWILEIIYGNPISQYQKISKGIYEMGGTAQKLEFPNYHPLLVMIFPNFQKAKVNYYERLAHKALLASELANLAGQPEILLDPYSEQPLKSLIRDGKAIFYSVGPNKTDNQLQDDDLVLPRKNS
ncbi:MAG: hypothetical protein HQM08_17565 [Candidatus Riflebacteria bacterium]|nr:hypothetical protein [Candidatus Riflebacteria bacterium]